MSPELANFLFEAANFLVLAGALGWVLFRPVRRALDAEQARRADAEAELAQGREQLGTERAALAAERRRLADEADGRRAELLEAARREAEELLSAARRDAERERERLAGELAARRRADDAQAVDAVGRLAAATVERLLREIAGPELDDALARAAAEALRAAGAGEGSGPATVEAARPLAPEVRRLFEQALPAGFEVVERPELGAGLRVVSSSGQLDLTALGLAREARRVLPEALGANAPDGAPGAGRSSADG